MREKEGPRHLVGVGVVVCSSHRGHQMLVGEEGADALRGVVVDLGVLCGRGGHGRGTDQEGWEDQQAHLFRVLVGVGYDCLLGRRARVFCRGEALVQRDPIQSCPGRDQILHPEDLLEVDRRQRIGCFLGLAYWRQSPRMGWLACCCCYCCSTY